MKATFTVGVSASGKSTWAKEESKRTKSMIICRDDIRADILREAKADFEIRDLWKLWNFKREKEVNVAIEDMIQFAKLNGLSVIFADTNLNKDRLRESINKMTALGFETEVKYFPIDDISVAIKRDAKREPSVGESVIKKQWLQWLELGEDITGIRRYVSDNNLPSAIVVDIDGTVAKMKNRGPFEWDKVGQDEPRYSVIAPVELLGEYCEVIFLSGRDGCCEEATRKWLNTHVDVDSYKLFMRSPGDMRKDRIIKSELFWEHVAPFYNVVGVYDDRKQMIEFWQDTGVELFNVGNTYEDF